MARTAFYFSAAWIFESHFTGAAVTVFKQKNHLGMLRKSFEKISGRWMPDSRRGYFSRDVANGVCTGSASMIKTAKKNEETNTKEKNMKATNILWDTDENRKGWLMEMKSTNAEEVACNFKDWLVDLGYMTLEDGIQDEQEIVNDFYVLEEKCPKLFNLFRDICDR